MQEQDSLWTPVQVNAIPCNLPPRARETSSGYQAVKGQIFKHGSVYGVTVDTP